MSSYTAVDRQLILHFKISVRVVSSNWTSLQLIPAFRQTSIRHLVNQGQLLPGGSMRRGITTVTAMASLSPSYASTMVVGGSQQLNSCRSLHIQLVRAFLVLLTGSSVISG